MSIRGTLALDHFYIGIEDQEFADLKQVLSPVARFRHSVVETDDGDSWEGCYLYSRSTVYFEVVRERRRNGLGICLSPFMHRIFDASRVVAECSELEWKSGRRERLGQPWYGWFSTANYIEHHNGEFVSWIMKYHQRDRDYPDEQLPEAADIDRFQSATIKCHPSKIEDALAHTKWFPLNSVIREENKLTIQLKQPDSLDFTFELIADEGTQDLRLSHLVFRSHDLKDLPQSSRGAWNLKKVDTGIYQLTLAPRKS